LGEFEELGDDEPRERVEASALGDQGEHGAVSNGPRHSGNDVIERQKARSPPRPSSSGYELVATTGPEDDSTAMILNDHSNHRPVLKGPTAGGSDGLYRRFVDYEGGDITRAKKRLAVTKKWREEVGADTMLRVGQPNFWPIKCFVPHCFHGYSKLGQPVTWQRPSGMRLGLLWKHGQNLDTFVKQYTLVEEYLAGRVHKSDYAGNIIKVIDLAGLKRSQVLQSEMRKLLKHSMKLASHYPGRTAYLLLVNMPGWGAMLMSMLNALMAKDDSRIVLSFTPAKTLEGLRRLIDDDQIPSELGGSSPHALGAHPLEVGFWQQVRRQNFELGVEPVAIKPEHRASATGYLPPPPHTFDGPDHHSGAKGGGGARAGEAEADGEVFSEDELLAYARAGRRAPSPPSSRPPRRSGGATTGEEREKLLASGASSSAAAAPRNGRSQSPAPWGEQDLAGIFPAMCEWCAFEGDPQVLAAHEREAHPERAAEKASTAAAPSREGKSQAANGGNVRGGAGGVGASRNIHGGGGVSGGGENSSGIGAGISHGPGVGKDGGPGSVAPAKAKKSSYFPSMKSLTPKPPSMKFFSSSKPKTKSIDV